MFAALGLNWVSRPSSLTAQCLNPMVFASQYPSPSWFTAVAKKSYQPSLPYM